MMKKGGRGIWREKLAKTFLHEKTVIISFVFLIFVLTFDHEFQILPISNHCIILTTIIIVVLTTCACCHGIKWAITSEKPFEISDKETKIKRYVYEWEKKWLTKIIHGFCDSCQSLEYLTNFNEQIRLLVKDIEKNFIKTWYSELSQNPSFLFDTHLMLEEIVFKIIKKLKKMDCKNFLASILLLYLHHLQEYRRSMKKLLKLKCETDSKHENIDLSDVWKYLHPCSQSDQILNYHLEKLIKVIFKEFSPNEFSHSLQCKIISGVIAKKVMRKFITTVEDPIWLNLKLIYLLNEEKYDGILQGGIYVVNEKILTNDDNESNFDNDKPLLLLRKRYFSSNLFENTNYFFDTKNEKNDGKMATMSEGIIPTDKTTEKKTLTLQLHKDKDGGGGGNDKNDTKENISTVLSGLITSTAGPLLPDNVSFHYHALNKMWQSPVTEVKDISESITNSLKKVFVNGVKEKRGLTRSKSTDSIMHALSSESNLKIRDISVGEELCESTTLGSSVEEEEEGLSPKEKKLTRTQSSNENMMMMMMMTGDDDEMNGDEIKPEETESSNNLEEIKDVSPVYEEPEDFATTIAKLRSLLQQRESSSTLSGKSNASIDLQSGAEKCHSG